MYKMQKTKYKRQKIKLGFRLIWVASIGKAASQTFPATCMGVYLGEISIGIRLCVRSIMRLQLTSVCAYWSNVHFKTTRLRVYTCCLPAVVTRALCVHERCDDCTEPHSFIWTGGEEPGADYNLIYWAKLWGSDRGPLALGLPPTPRAFYPHLSSGAHCLYSKR